MKKKKILAALLVGAMAAGMLTGCGSKGGDKTFTVGFDAEFPPYGYMDENGELINGENGVQKVLIDGELFILRGEKMYDAKGQLVK